MISMIANDVANQDVVRSMISEATMDFLAAGNRIERIETIVRQRVTEMKKPEFNGFREPSLQEQSMINTIKAMIAERKGVMEIANALKIAPRKAHSLAARGGFQIPKATTAEAARLRFDEARNKVRAEKLPLMKKLLATGMTTTEVAKVIGVARATVWRWNREN
jgi:DNA-binding CsgD family transcriptional regulator